MNGSQSRGPESDGAPGDGDGARRETPEAGSAPAEPVDCTSDANEVRMQSVFRAAPIGIGVVVQRVFQDVNERFCEITGYAREEVIGQDARMLYITEAEYEHVGRIKYRQIALHGAGTVETRFQRKDGAVIDVILSSAPIDTADLSAGVTFTVLDITDRKQAEQALRESEARFAAFMDFLPGFAYLKDAGRRYLFVNRSLEQWFGVGPSAWRGQTLTELFPALDTAAIDANDQQVLRTGSPVQVEEQITVGDEARTFLSIRFPVGPPGGERLIGGISTDITKRTVAEAQLRESQRALATLMSNLPGMAYRCRADEFWTMDFVSDGCHSLTGYTPHQLIENRTVSFGELIHPDDRAGVRELVEAGLAEHRPFDLSYRIRDASGGQRWVWERGRGVFAADDSLLFLEGFIWDTTQRHRAEQERDRLEMQLRQSQKMEAVGQLAGGVAHDFNNILTAIFGNVELAMGQLRTLLPDAQGLLDGLRQIERSAERAATLTRQLLAFSRRQIVRPEIVNLNETLLELEKMLRRLITEDIALHLRCEPGLQSVKADPGQLEQVIINLVVNARDAMPDGGRLTLETKNIVLDEAHVATHPEASPGSHVQLAVSDTGHGMDATTRERVFEPFFTTKPVGEGTGLGLSTVYGIVKQAGGSIVAYSEAGLGTTFKLYLPAVERTARPRSSRAAESAPRGSETILLCEDDAPVRALTAELLREAGYVVLVAARAREAVDKALASPTCIDLLITDVIMPDMNGRALSDALAARLPGLRTLFISGYTSNVIAQHGVLDEQVAFLEKPYSRRQLLARVRAVLDAQPAADGD